MSGETRYAFDDNTDNGIRVDVHERRGRITLNGKPGNGSIPMRSNRPRPRPGVYRFSVLVVSPDVLSVIDPILPEITFGLSLSILHVGWESWHRTELDTLHVTTDELEDVIENGYANRIVPLPTAFQRLQQRINAHETSNQRRATRVIRRLRGQDRPG